MASGLWPLASGLWPLAYGRDLGFNREPIANRRWAYGLWPLASGLRT